MVSQHLLCDTPQVSQAAYCCCQAHYFVQCVRMQPCWTLQQRWSLSCSYTLCVCVMFTNKRRSNWSVWLGLEGCSISIYEASSLSFTCVGVVSVHVAEHDVTEVFGLTAGSLRRTWCLCVHHHLSHAIFTRAGRVWLCFCTAMKVQLLALTLLYCRFVFRDCWYRDYAGLPVCGVAEHTEYFRKWGGAGSSNCLCVACVAALGK